ncbi:hypothetical protein P3G55_20620 [Leptospira sp. 96542]|nr:hypothetical protein [Leptospira sp. 96542]
MCFAIIIGVLMKCFISFLLATVLISCSSTVEKVKNNRADGSSFLMIVKIIDIERIDTYDRRDYTKFPINSNLDFIVLSVLIQNSSEKKISVSTKPKIILPQDRAVVWEAERVENCCNFLETVKANLIQLPQLFSDDPLLLFKSFEIEPNQLALKTFYFPFPRNQSPEDFLFLAKFSNDASYDELLVNSYYYYYDHPK